MSSPASEDPGTVEIPAGLGGTESDLAAWRQRWESGAAFTIPSRPTGLRARLTGLVKRALNPLVTALWKRQSAFNLSLIDHLEAGDQSRTELLRDLRQVRSDLLRDVQNNHRRISHLEAFKREGFGDVMQHSDALYAVVDQKLDRYRRQSRDLWSRLGSLLARVEDMDPERIAAELEQGWREQGYRSLEDRFRGTQEEISERVATYLPHLPPQGEVLDLGCGRGEALEYLGSKGLSTRGVDSSEAMVEECRGRGLSARCADLFEVLAECPEGSLAGIISLHVIEHLDGSDLDRLVRLAWRALAPGGALILETPNPLSLVVAARNFWRDPTHRRPIHPDTLAFLFEEAGFEPVERLDLRPFGEEESLPDLDLEELPVDQRFLAQGVNEIRDRLDALLFGYQDYAMVGKKPVQHRTGQSSAQIS